MVYWYGGAQPVTSKVWTSRWGAQGNDLRQTEILDLGLSQEQDDILQEYLESNNPNEAGTEQYNEFSNSCVTQCEKALVETDILPTTTTAKVLSKKDDVLHTRTFVNTGNRTPETLGESAERAGIVKNKTTVGTANGSKASSAINTVKNVVKRLFGLDDE